MNLAQTVGRVMTRRFCSGLTTAGHDPPYIGFMVRAQARKEHGAFHDPASM